jgi:hypothetical protein
MSHLVLALIWTFAAICWTVGSVFWFRAGNSGLGFLNVVVAIANFVPAVMYYMQYLSKG